MEKKTKEKSIASLAFARTKKTWVRKSNILAILFLFYLVTLGLALLLPLSLIVTIPFVCAPATFSFLAINTVLDSKIDNDTPGFFHLFKLYFDEHFGGTFSLFKSFLFSLIVFAIGSTLVSIGGAFVIEFAYPDVLEQLMQIYLIQDEMEFIEAIQNFMFGNEVISAITEIEVYVSFGASFIFFVHYALKNSVKIYFNLLSSVPIFSRDLNLTHKETMKIIKKMFNKDYFISTWFISLLFLAGYVGGVFLGRLALNLDASQSIIAGMFGSLLLTFIFIPYYFDVTLCLFKKYADEYYAEFTRLSFDTIQEMKKNKTLSEDKEKEILNFLGKEQADLDDYIKEKNNKKKNKKNHD